MDDSGNMTILFSEEMNTTFSKPYLNNSLINIYIQNNKEPEEKPRNLNFTWDVTSFEGKELKISVGFEMPL